MTTAPLILRRVLAFFAVVALVALSILLGSCAMDRAIVVPLEIPGAHAVGNKACADCHSNQTEWPWYSHIAPTSWFVVDHVNHGRRHINFSTWVRPGHEPADSIDRLKAICREVKGGDMPLTSYELIHWRSWLSVDDVNKVCAWSEAEQKRLSAIPK